MKHINSYRVFREINENYLDANDQVCSFQDGDKVKTETGNIGTVSRIESSMEDGKKVTKALVKFNNDGMTSSGFYPIEKLSKA